MITIVTLIPAVSHIQDFGDATTSPAEDATPRARDAGVGVRDAHL